VRSLTVKELDMLKYPQCPLCNGSVRRPCTLAVHGKEPLIVCGACFRIAMILGRMQAHGVFEVGE